MNAPINIQVIKLNGQPAFVVIPYSEYIKAFPEDNRWVPEGEDLIPHEVVGMTMLKGFTLIRAWREYLGLTQNEVADRMGITQAALSQMESGEKRLRRVTLEKLASALGLNLEQIRE